MTGLLAVSGIVLVLLASAYSGITESESEAVDMPGLEITPVTDVDDEENTDQPEQTPEPEPVVPTATPTQVLNRNNCEEIRGTDYFSPEERTWFLANCVN